MFKLESAFVDRAKHATSTWTSPLHRRQFFENYAQDHGFDFLSPNAWYSEPFAKIISVKGATGVIYHHSNSIPTALMDLFPDIGLERQGFLATPFRSKKSRSLSPGTFELEHRISPAKTVTLSGKTNSPKPVFVWSPFKRRRFFEKYAAAKGFDFRSAKAWYAEPIHKVLATKGSASVLVHHKKSVPKALMDLFPDIGLEESSFKKWDNRKRRRLFFENYARSYGFDYLSPGAWYSQRFSTIIAYKHAASVLKYYKYNISDALIDLFPEVDLQKSLFKSKKMRHSASPLEVTQAKPLPIQSDFIHQGHLEQVVRDLFPSVEVIYDTKKKAQVTNPDTGNLFEIDVWVPELQLGFEFQDNYHYMRTWYARHSLDIIQQLDASKRNAARLAQMSLIQVPFWWDGASESLVAAIQFERPELLVDAHSASPITFNPPFGSLEKVPDVGTLMLASFPLNNNFTTTIGSRAWWMGEKYDGVRCCWNPDQCAAYSRSGKLIPVPENIFAALPDVLIDGEFWFGRGMFSLTYSLLHGDSSWYGLRMISFDYPHQSLHHLPFEQRYRILLDFIPESHPITIVAQRMLCNGSAQLNSLMGKVIDYGGEGIILRRVGSRYEQGRNRSLIKLKTEYGDTEGLVVGVDTKAISLKLPNGQIFKVPMPNVHVAGLQVGEVVTFSYQKIARRDMPVHPEIFRRRTDLKWEDVLSSSKSHHIQVSEPSENFTTKPRGFWNFENMREYIANFAKNLNLDPLLPATWLKIPVASIFETKGGKYILQKFKEPLLALTTLFPDIGLNIDKVKMSVPLKRRQFFEKYAKENGFDFLSAKAWYSHSRSKIAGAAGASKVLSYHKNSVARALVDLFPDIGLEKSKFTNIKYDLHSPTEQCNSRHTEKT